jgi:hypothetical protein
MRNGEREVVCFARRCAGRAAYFWLQVGIGHRATYISLATWHAPMWRSGCVRAGPRLVRGVGHQGAGSRLILMRPIESYAFMALRFRVSVFRFRAPRTTVHAPTVATAHMCGACAMRPWRPCAPRARAPVTALSACAILTVYPVNESFYQQCSTQHLTDSSYEPLRISST